MNERSKKTLTLIFEKRINLNNTIIKFTSVHLNPLTFGFAY